jgi:hypothetical protein
MEMIKICCNGKNSVEHGSAWKLHFRSRFVIAVLIDAIKSSLGFYIGLNDLPTWEISALYS